MERVIASLQRERFSALLNIEQFEAALADRKAQAEELERAILALGGAADAAACEEAEQAWQRKVNAPSMQEQARAPSSLGFIAGQHGP